MNGQPSNICLNKNNSSLILGNKGRIGLSWIVPTVPVSIRECSKYTISA